MVILHVAPASLVLRVTIYYRGRGVAVLATYIQLLTCGKPPNESSSNGRPPMAHLNEVTKLTLDAMFAAMTIHELIEVTELLEAIIFQRMSQGQEDGLMRGGV